LRELSFVSGVLASFALSSLLQLDFELEDFDTWHLDVYSLTLSLAVRPFSFIAELPPSPLGWPRCTNWPFAPFAPFAQRPVFGMQALREEADKAAMGERLF
jgi:hypothetical protein